jgi:hypothetical protein
VGEQFITDNIPLGTQFGNGAAEIDGVPEDDGGDGEIDSEPTLGSCGRPAWLRICGPTPTAIGTTICCRLVSARDAAGRCWRGADEGFT